MIPRLDIHFSKHDRYLFSHGEPYQPQKNEFLLNHARSAIFIALQALDLKQGSRVGVMTYNCHTVFEAVLAAQCTPVFIDVTNDLTLDLNDLSTKHHDIQALIVTHLFGIENSIANIRQLIGDIPIIEDCAHAYGMKTIQGDFATFSIGQGKLPSIGDGGILVVQNAKYLPAVNHLYSQIPLYSSKQERKLYRSLCLKAFLYRPWVYTLLTYHLKKNKHTPLNPHLAIMKMSRGVSAIYNQKRNCVDQQVQYRKANLQLFKELFCTTDHLPHYLIGSNAFMLVIDCANKKDSLQRHFARNGIDTATHFSQCIDWATTVGYVKGSCPNAERLTSRLLMLPTHLDANTTNRILKLFFVFNVT